MKPEPILCVDIGGTKSIVGLCDSTGEILCSLNAERPHGEEADWIRDSVFKRIDRLAVEAPEVFSDVSKMRHRFWRTSSEQSPGPIDACAGVGRHRPSRRYQIAVRLRFADGKRWDHASDGGARFWRGKGYRKKNRNHTQQMTRQKKTSLIFANLGTGFGGGIIASGEPFLGDVGFAGHFGHMCVEANGRPCLCGNRGCAETYCSGIGLDARCA